MSIITFEKKYIRGLWLVNGVLFVLMLAASLTNDSNGRLPGLNEMSSRAVLLSIVVLGLLADGLTIWFDKNGKRRAMAVAIAMVYLLMLIPAFG